MSSAAVVIGALRVRTIVEVILFFDSFLEYYLPRFRGCLFVLFILSFTITSVFGMQELNYNYLKGYCTVSSLFSRNIPNEQLFMREI